MGLAGALAKEALDSGAGLTAIPGLEQWDVCAFQLVKNRTELVRSRDTHVVRAALARKERKPQPQAE